MSRSGLAVLSVALVMALGAPVIVAYAQSTTPTEAQRRECERNGGYWSSAAGYCRIGAKAAIRQ